jgi:CRP/FNR family cyclic AMP-dependent transcriptional regulator
LKQPSDAQREMLLRFLGRAVASIKLGDLLPPGHTGIWKVIAGCAVKQRFGAGERVSPGGDPAPWMMILQRGTISIFRQVGDRRILVKRLEPGTVLGEMPAWGQTMLCTEAVAALPSEILLFDRAAAELVRTGTPGLALRLGEMNGQGRVGVLRLFEAVKFRSADSRLASFLLERADDDGFVVGLTHQDIADHIMTERKTVTVALGRMRRAGLIAIKRKKIVLLRLEALLAIASGRRELPE